MATAERDGRVLLVTGGTGSVGRAVAIQAAREGWTVLVHGRTAASAARAVAALDVDGAGAGRLFACAGDFGRRGEVLALIDEIAGAHDRIDAIVHCAVSAPVGITGAFLDTDPDAYDALCRHAVTSLLWLCHAAFPVMAKGGGGGVVAISSDAGRFAAPNQALIAATRAAVMAFCRNVALDVARQGIRVNCVASSFVADSAIFDAMVASGSARAETARRRAGLGLPHCADVAALALFLAGPSSRHTTGQIVSVNGGLNA